jgi:hypothetical protein
MLQQDDGDVHISLRFTKSMNWFSRLVALFMEVHVSVRENERAEKDKHGS